MKQNKNYFSTLTKEEHEIIVNKGTEKPFSGKYNNFYLQGIFVCKACEKPLYKSSSKFDSEMTPFLHYINLLVIQPDIFILKHL